MIFDRFSSKKGGAIQYIIAGLGNPGPKYDNTRHNTGFRFADAFAKRNGAVINRLRFHALCADMTVSGVRCLLMKPQTLMNRSGLAISEAARFYKIPPEKIIVVFDDISLEVGRLRIRRHGSDGGHNGAWSVIEQLNSEDFPRIKIGIGKKPNPEYDLAAWVLSKFTDSESAEIDRCAARACEACELLLTGDIDGAMSRFNN